MRRYRVFAQDVGKDGYSGVYDVLARSPAHAVEKAKARWPKLPFRYVALPHDRKDLWPDGQTGQLPAGALEYQDAVV